MPKEYIEREDTIEKIKQVYCSDCNSHNGVMCRACQIDDAILQIDAEPAADVAPVVHSEWINRSGGNATCKRCGVRQFYVYDDDGEQNFCGHCGAIMDGGSHVET